MGSVVVGERVTAMIGGTGLPRPGVVTAVLHGSFLQPNPQYLVHFDGDKGHSGPCFYAVPETTKDA